MDIRYSDEDLPPIKGRYCSSIALTWSRGWNGASSAPIWSDLISTPILNFIARPRTRKRADKQNGRRYCYTAVRIARSALEVNLQATRGTMHRYLPPVDEREEAPLAQPVRTLTGRTRSKLPVSQEHRLPVALPARGYNPFTSLPLSLFRPFLPFNNYINDNVSQ